MPHLDAERLSLLAIGEPTSGEEQAHLDACDQCALELAELEYTVAVGRSTAGLGELATPPEAVWERISQELGLGGAAPAAPLATEPAVAPRRNRRRGMVVALAASIAAVGVVGGGTWALWQAQRPAQLAAATLEAFPSHPDAAGEAVVLEDRDGTRQVRVQLDAAETGQGHKEVWLITGDASALVSLGVMDGVEGAFTVPDDVDLDEYVLVDVSLEPDDGDPGHSGDSIVRGELSEA